MKRNPAMAGQMDFLRAHQKLKAKISKYSSPLVATLGLSLTMLGKHSV